jgi:hypothetical protein
MSAPPDRAVPSPPGYPPPPVPIGPTPVWVMALGAVFGGITLIGLLVFAYIAGKDASFVCNAFTVLAAVFAFGAALAAGFIGGGAAVTGNLGATAKNYAMLFSAGGGIAVFFIAFGLFHFFKGDVCARDSAEQRHRAEVGQLEARLKEHKTIIEQRTATVAQLEEDKRALEKKIASLKEQPITIVAISSRTASLKQITIEYNSKTEGWKRASRANNVFKIQLSDLNLDDPGIFVSYDRSELTAEWEDQELPPVGIERFDHQFDPLSIKLFLTPPQRLQIGRNKP